MDAMTRLEAAADQLEIIAVLTAYGHALDRGDGDALAACFHPDSQHKHGAFEGSSREFIGFATQVLDGLDSSHHHLSAPYIRLEGDTAHVESYFIAHQRIPAHTPPDAVVQGSGVPQDMIIAGRYIDRFEKRGGRWAIARRTGVHDWQRLEPAADAGFADLPADQRGQRGPADPAWAIMRR